jgi:GNAT superfamily N-acetyltransferase
MNIRSAAPDDIPLILDFIRGLAEYERLSHEVEATPALLRASLFPESGRPAAECVLAFEEGSPAGFAVFFTSFSTFLARPGLYLEDIFVIPERRGRGVGTALLLHLARLANERGCGRMEWSVLDWNESAITFYEGLGARRLSEWTTCRLDGDALRGHA